MEQLSFDFDAPGIAELSNVELARLALLRAVDQLCSGITHKKLATVVLDLPA